jgi:hypothetical protein
MRPGKANAAASAEAAGFEVAVRYRVQFRAEK